MLLVKIDDDKYEAGSGIVYSYQAVKNAIYRQIIEGGFIIKKSFVEYAVCIVFDYNTFEISFYDRYFIVTGEYTSKKFCQKDNAEKWQKKMSERTGTEFRIHEVTQKNFMKNSNL